MSDHFEERFGPVVGKGAQATVYADGRYAVKLYREGYPKGYVFSEAYMMANLEKENFPSPRVYEVLLVDGRYGIRMDQVKGRLMAEAIADPARYDEALDALVNLQCRVQKLGTGVQWAPDIKERLRGDLLRSTRLSDRRRQTLLEKLQKLPDGNGLCHCDFHAGNVFFDGKDYIIIDLLQIARGDPAADAACSYVSYSFAGGEIAKDYLNRYCEASGIAREDVMRWVPPYAGMLLGEVPKEYAAILERFIGSDGEG